AYADHLGLDGDEVVRRFKEESTGLRRKAALDFPIPTPDSGIPSGLSLLGAVLLGMAVYGSWYAVSRPARTFALVQEVPTRLTANAGSLGGLVSGEVTAPLGDSGAVASRVPLEVDHVKSGD